MTVVVVDIDGSGKRIPFAVPADWISAAAYAPEKNAPLVRAFLRSHINRVDQRIARAADAEHDAVVVVR